jgi:hypothetical protein
MRALTGWLLFASVTLGAGCGPSDKPDAAVRKTRSADTSIAPSTDKGASAEQVAGQARGAVACPPKLATPPRTDGQPVDDILGVRPGQTYGEAMNGALCTNELLVATPETSRGFTIKPYGQKVNQGFSARFAEPREVKTGKQIVQEMQREAMARGANALREDLKPGQSKWYVGTMGVPGAERVLSVGREERFAAGQNPTMATVRAALEKKYGTPTRALEASATQMPVVRWAHDPAGRWVAEGSPLIHRCVNHPDPNVGSSLNPECGVVVEAMLIPLKSNPDLVDRLMVTVVDQAGGYRAIAATEQALAQQDQQRRAQEMEKAAKTVKGPSL